jgi:hypothetical protein
MSNARQTLVDRILARFALITTAGGYQTNVGAVVREWQTTPLDEAEITTILVRDPVATALPDPNGPNSSKHSWAQQIIVDAVLQESAQNAVEARKTISDINKAVGVDQTWGGLARRSDQVSEKLMLDKEGGHVAGVQVIFNVITSRRQWEP